MKPEAIEAAKRIVAARGSWTMPDGEWIEKDGLICARALLASEPTQTDRETARAIAESEHYTDADSLTEAIAAAIASARTAARAEALEEAARIARNACLVPPDGGSPTEDEKAICDFIEAAIRARKGAA